MAESTSAPASHTQELPFPAPAVGWYATSMLAFLYWLSVLDRQIIALLVDPIKMDLGLSDVQYALLHGLAFVLAYSVFGLLFGVLADRMSRRWAIFIGVSVWSIGTAACGLAKNFTHLLLARIGVGAGEASLNPCATSMISDLFPREKLTSAMAIYAIGATVGSGTALIIGGAIVDYVSGIGPIVLPLFGEIRPWQAVFLIVGLPGALLAFTVFTVPEPVRRNRAHLSPSRTWRTAFSDLYRFVGKHPRFFACHYAGFTLAAAAMTGCAAWYPAYMARAFGWSAGQIGLVLGTTFTAVGIFGKLLCGWTADAMYRRGYRDAQLRWYVASLIIGTPLGLWATTSSNPWVFVVGIGGFMLLIASLPACAITALNLVTPNELRGTGVAVFTTVSGLIGQSAGAVIVAVLSKQFFEGERSIGLGMAVLIGVACPLAAVALAMGLKSMRKAMAAIEGGTPTLARGLPRCVQTHTECGRQRQTFYRVELPSVGRSGEGKGARPGGRPTRFYTTLEPRRRSRSARPRTLEQPQALRPGR